MSVSDDSKVKLIQTKTEIIYSVFKRFNNKEFQKCLTLTELKVKNPEIYELIERYDKSSLESNFSAEEVFRHLYQSFKEKCIEILELISGQDINSEEFNDSEIQNRLQSKLNKLSEEMTKTQSLSQSLEKKFENYQKLFIEYLDVIQLYYNKYKIPFKLSFDEIYCNLSMSKAQTLCLRNRFIETESIAKKYGNKELIASLKNERKTLESEEFRLKTELKKAETLLAEYESLDKDLLKEYRRLKSDLECRLWAINELNQSTGSSKSDTPDIGTVNDSN